MSIRRRCACGIRTTRVFVRENFSVAVCSRCDESVTKTMLNEARCDLWFYNDAGSPCCGRVLNVSNLAVYRTPGSTRFYLRDAMNEMCWQSGAWHAVRYMKQISIPAVAVNCILSFLRNPGKEFATRVNRLKRRKKVRKWTNYKRLRKNHKYVLSDFL